MKCSCTNVQRAVYEFDRSELSIEYVEHIESCAQCSAAQLSVTQLRSVVRLKAYEQPDPEALQRCMNEVHLKLVEHQDGLRRTEAGEAHPLSGWRYGIAGAFLCLIVLNGFIAGRLPSLETGMTADELAPSRSPVLFASTNHQDFANPSPTSLFPSNSSSGRSVLTTFD